MFRLGGLIRMIALHHVVFSVNSICHLFGQAPYDTRDESRNNLIFGSSVVWRGATQQPPCVSEFGDLRHRWYEIDLGGYFIRAMRMSV